MRSSNAPQGARSHHLARALRRARTDGAKLLCPRRDKPGSVWLPGYWQRRHILWTSAVLFVMLLMVLAFASFVIFVHVVGVQVCELAFVMLGVTEG